MSGSPLKLENGSDVAVIGGGPAGSFFSYFLLYMAQRAGISLKLDIYEAKDFSLSGPAGCNHCGGIISESLVQLLATEGIILPGDVVRKGIDTYVLHTDQGKVHIETPIFEKRIAAVYRGTAPLGGKHQNWRSFDGYLLQLAAEHGADLIRELVTEVSFQGPLPTLKTKSGTTKSYDLVVGAGGINSTAPLLFEKMSPEYKPSVGTSAFISEIYLGTPIVREHFGDAMHVFLINFPRLDFAAIIPKGDYVTLVILGDRIDEGFVDTFLNTPEVRGCFPRHIDPAEKRVCRCSPEINIKAAVHPFRDRVVLVGDASAARLLKDGIGTAYVTAKAAATTAIFYGISSQDFERHFQPVCRSISFDNMLGKIIFASVHQVQRIRFMKKGLLNLVSAEQQDRDSKKRLSMVLWDMFTGSAPYRDIFRRVCHPALHISFLCQLFKGVFPGTLRLVKAEETQGLGKLYSDGEDIIRENELVECMYVIQQGKVEVFKSYNGIKVHLADMGEGDFFGEMALFERKLSASSVRAKGEVRVLTVDKKTFLKQVQEDPTTAFRVVEKMSSRLRAMNFQISRIKSGDRRNWDTRPDSKPKDQ